MIEREQQVDRQRRDNLKSSRHQAARLVLVLIASLTLAACASEAADTSPQSTLVPSSAPALGEKVRGDAAGEPNSLASTSKVEQPEPVGWDGRWTGAEDGVQVAFTVADGKLSGGTVRSASWRTCGRSST